MKQCQCEGCKRARMPESVGYQPCAGGPYRDKPNGLAALMVIVVVVGLLGLSLLINPVHAGEVRLLGGGWSYHTDRSEYYNEQHHMVGLAWRGWSAIAFENSEPADGGESGPGSEAYGIGHEWMYPVGRFVELGGYAGVWTGYEDWPHGRPVAALRGRFTLDRFGVSVSTVGVVTTLHLEWAL